MYYEYFGLRDAPFKFLPSNTLFLSAAHLEGLAALEWAFNEPSGLTLLVGEVGTGKTMLIHSLMARHQEERIRIGQISNPTMSFEEMIPAILQQIGIRPAGQGKLAALQALKTFISDPDSKERVILIFDEAQGLKDEVLEELRLLSNSRPPQRHALQIILVGQPELVERLTDPKLRALNQRIGARALLRPLRGEEIREYIDCLVRAQGARRELFSRGALNRIAELSGGLPRKINNLCHNALFHAYSQQSQMVEARHVQAAGAELDNLLNSSSGNYRTRSWDWIVRRSRPVMVGGLAAVVAVALAFEVFATRHSQAPSAQSADVEAALPVEAVPAKDLHQTAPVVPAIASPDSSSPSANHAAKPQEQTNPVTGGPSTHVVTAAAPPLASKTEPGSEVDTVASAGTGGAGMPKIENAPAAPATASTPPDSSDRLTYRQERRLEYEMKRAKVSFDSGRYLNSIYHSKRVLLVDPGNAEARDLLQRAEAARSNPGAAAINSRPAPLVESNIPPPASEDTNAAAPPSEDSNVAASTADKNPVAEASNPPVHFADVARAEINEGDADMRAGKYDMALRKFLTAAVLDPDNQTVQDRIERAREAQGRN
jgi:general secretion pathway protein A